MKDLTDVHLVEMAGQGLGTEPSGRSAAQAELTRRLIVATNQASHESHRLGSKVLALNVALVVFTVVLVVLTVVLVVQGGD